jgi:hypothetical protein
LEEKEATFAASPRSSMVDSQPPRTSKVDSQPLQGAMEAAAPRLGPPRLGAVPGKGAMTPGPGPMMPGLGSTVPGLEKVSHREAWPSSAQPSSSGEADSSMAPLL